MPMQHVPNQPQSTQLGNAWPPLSVWPYTDIICVTRPYTPATYCSLPALLPDGLHGRWDGDGAPDGQVHVRSRECNGAEEEGGKRKAER